MSNERKNCPMCGEEILAAAKKCKHCGEYLDRGLVTGARTMPGAPTPNITGAETIFPEVAPDLILAGLYRVIREIGRGGMGIVYLAHDETLGIDVAVKVLPTMFAANARAVEALKAEARTAMKLAHPGIVKLYNFVEDTAANFLVMEYVEGESLDQILQKKGKLSLDRTLEIARQIAPALDYAHSQSILHRDIKPGNILVASDSREPESAIQAKLTDFGIAREMKNTMTRLTGRQTAGTLLYMSPEQLMGEKLDARADIYSFAATLYECLAGHPPFFDGDIPTQIMRKPPTPIDGQPAHVNNALRMALSKDKADRPTNCVKLAQLVAMPSSGETLLREPVMERSYLELKSAETLAGFKAVEAEGRDKDAGLWKEIQHVKNGIRLRLIPAGEFDMGSPATEQAKWDQERPVHRVKISKPFYMGKYEVTQGQWKAVMGGDNNPSHFKGDDLPVETVSWNDTQDFLNKAEGGLRLPTEAEWEYACRAGSKGQWCFGDDESTLGDYAWYYKNSGNQTHPVGQKKPNDLGLYDMHGNVCEWCSDWYGEKYYEECKNGVADPTGPGNGAGRVLRGGSWYGGAWVTRSANRVVRYETDGGNNVIGFRVIAPVRANN